MRLIPAMFLVWLLVSPPAHAQVKPRIYIIVDTSDSMAAGAHMAMAKSALENTFHSTTDAEFSLTSFMMTSRCASFPCSCAGSDAHCTDFPPGGDVLVDFPVPTGGNTAELISWVDLNCTDSPLNPELEAFGGGTGGGTPHGPTIDLAGQRLATTIGADSHRGCRPYRVVLITDGTGTCWAPNAITDAVAALWDITPDVDPACTVDLDCPSFSWCDTSSGKCVYEAATHVIAIDTTLSLLDEMADVGDDTVVNGSAAALVATSVSDIRNALIGIVNDAVPVEACDGRDNDCDGDIDEEIPGLGLVCGTDIGECEPGLTACDSTLSPPRVVCEGEIEPVPEVCNGLDDNCNGTIDDGMGVGDPCGTNEGECEEGAWGCNEFGELECMDSVGPTPEECDCLDNDCDGFTIDEDEAPCPGAKTCIDCVCRGPECETDEDCLPCDRCIGGLCIYACEHCVEEECAEDEICLRGECVHVCDLVTCPDGEICVFVDGVTTCVPEDCDAPGHECAGDQCCVEGECIHCPEGTECIDGACIETVPEPEEIPDESGPTNISLTGGGGCAGCTIGGAREGAGLVMVLVTLLGFLLCSGRRPRIRR